MSGELRTQAPDLKGFLAKHAASIQQVATQHITADRMVELAAQQPGYLGVESVRGSDGLGITVSYWRDEAAILAWRRHAEHTLARERGRQQWYEHFELRVAKVERAYGGP